MVKFYQKAFMALSVIAWMSMPASTQAGGSWGGSFGGSSGGSVGGSSGGYAAAYASSGGGASSGGASSGGASWGGHQGGFLARMMARHSGGSIGGSSGGYASNFGSSGSSGGSVGSVGASSGGSSGGPPMGPLRRLAAKIHARKAALRHGSHGGSSGGSVGGSSGGQVSYASYSAGSSGGQVAYDGGGSSGGASHAHYGYSSSAIESVPLSSASYESPVMESSYESYDSYQPAPETIIDHGYQSGESIMDHGASIINDSSDAGVPYVNGIGQNLDVIRLGNSDRITVSDNGYSNGFASSLADSNDSDRYETAKPAIDADSVLMTIKVPSEAMVTVNDRETESDGEIRQFMSSGLKEGYVYTYVVKVQYDANGETMVHTKSVDLRPGDVEEIEFDIPATLQTEKQQQDDSVANEEVITVVRLNVPADAKVSLAGNETSGFGAVRTFRTKQLKQGQQWEDYTVQVTADVQGQLVTKERTVNVQAGSVIELTFDFEDTVIAAR